MNILLLPFLWPQIQITAMLMVSFYYQHDFINLNPLYVHLLSGEVNQKTEWHRICVFKPFLRDSTIKYTSKGQRVLVQGRIIYGEIKDSDGQLRHTSSIVADDVIFFKTV